jgi:hypothetical protein
MTGGGAALLGDDLPLPAVVLLAMRAGDGERRRLAERITLECFRDGSTVLALLVRVCDAGWAAIDRGGGDGEGSCTG